jgi:prevent-host-death family protein
MEVGVRELKEHLSEYLERAAQGEIIRVTDRGRPKAIIAPLPGRLLIDQGIAEGWIQQGREDEPVVRVQRQKAQRSTEAVLAEDRES